MFFLSDPKKFAKLLDQRGWAKDFDMAQPVRMKDFVQKFAVPLAAKFHQQRTIWKALLILRWMKN
jgi:hypothetical protein